MTAATLEQRLFAFPCARTPRRVVDEAILSPNVREIPSESRGRFPIDRAQYLRRGEISRAKGQERGRRW
jgi:hypothetical protein